MRHLKAGRRLNRNASHRDALMRNLTRALFEHGRIVTTVAKAKAARPFVEKLITLAKKGSLHARRLCIARLHDKEAVDRLFKEIAPRFADRPGGYTRIIKRHERRLGDAGETAFLELLKPGETARVRTPRPAAPRVTAPTPPPAPVTVPPPAATEPPPPAATEPAPPPQASEETPPPAP
jgi:large subunit ribosomal protein L17